MKAYVTVWVGLLLIVAVEVVLTYEHLPTERLLVALLLLAFVEAALGLMYLMHLKYERPVLFWSLIPYLIFAMFMLDHVWPDALRLMHQRLAGH
ncbi:MAG TPA: cytochrome C oxidase subunit IV family protein [Gemmatimonadales bacterium]|nr:cytochrome C oxidase subunit IV family protein [Gemmatimonadales bacterium]